MIALSDPAAGSTSWQYALPMQQPEIPSGLDRAIVLPGNVPLAILDSFGSSPMPSSEAFAPENGQALCQLSQHEVRNSRLPFLANFTSTHGLANSFGCGTPAQRAKVIQTLVCSQTRVLNDKSADTASGVSSHPPFVDAHLFAKTHAIASGVKSYHERRVGHATHSHAWPCGLRTKCCEFFCPTNLRRFLLAYWALWHPHYPVFHKPTFSEEDAPPTLIAAMVLIGACLSSDEKDRESAAAWIDLVGDWVFSSPELNDDVPPAAASLSEDSIRARLNALRAAYCVVLLQTWECGEQSKRTARRARYTYVISVTRSLCRAEVSHGDLQHYLGAPVDYRLWKAFALVEELIRTAMYVLLLDCGFCIFNNTPPRMTLEEARFAVPCPEVCFQAESPGSWLEATSVWAASHIGRRQPTIRLVVKLLAKDQVADVDWEMLRQMSSLGFFAAVQCMHPQVFQVRCHADPFTQATPVRNALANWRKLWLQRTGIVGLEERCPVCPIDSWRRIGFASHAEEFWSLTNFVLLSAETSQYPNSDGIGGVVQESLCEQLLSRYDESDMSQVRQVVDLFDGMSIQTV